MDKETGQIVYFINGDALANAQRILTRARNEITSPAEDELIDVCQALIDLLKPMASPSEKWTL